MTKKLLFLLIALYALNTKAQQSRSNILGVVKNDSLSVENVHVINKNSKKATLTNEFGEFRIPVKENDTLIFSGIQFENRKVIINTEDLESLQLIINLKADINQLEEITIKQHNLTGNLAVDSNAHKDSIYEMTKSALDFSNIDFSVVVINNIDEIDRAKPPDASRLTNPNIPVGGNILGLLNPLLKPLDRIGERKRTERKAKAEFEKKSRKVPDKVREEYGDLFFTKTLKVPLNQIDSFILHCMNKGLAKLYIENKKIELIELMLVESKLYNKKSKNE